MFSTSFSHFVLGIIVLLLVMKDCDAYTVRGIKKLVAEAGDGVPIQARKEMHNGKEIFIAVPGDFEDTSGIVGGRKMIVKTRALSNDQVKKEESKKIGEKASKISGASCVGNSSNTWKGKLKMRSKLSSRNMINHQLKVKTGGLMALSADYHMEKTHPPRHN